MATDVEGWDRARAKSLPLIPKVLDGFDFVLHEKDPSNRDILIFAKKFTNKKGRPNTVVMRVIDDGKTIGPISTHVRDLTDTWLKNKDLVTTNGNEVYDRGEDNSASRSPTPTDNAERNSVGTVDSIAKQNVGDNGVAKMSVGTPRVDFDPEMVGYDPNLKAMGDLEQNAGGLAAAIEKKEALRPWTKKGSPCDLAKPIALS